MREITDQNNSEYGYFSHIEVVWYTNFFCELHLEWYAFSCDHKKHYLDEKIFDVNREKVQNTFYALVALRIAMEMV